MREPPFPGCPPIFARRSVEVSRTKRLQGERLRKSTAPADGVADDYPLTVDADHGRVTLTGVLASPQDVHRAVALAAGIDGVKGVNNRLTSRNVPQ
jgi:osmotically-inducible protein OsmY